MDFIADNIFKIIIFFIVLIIALTIWQEYYTQKHCSKWEFEKQYQPPVYTQPGKDGGISIPLSNGKWVDVKVCREFNK